MSLNINAPWVRNLCARLIGLRAGSIGEADELVKLVIEAGRRGEFDLLYEQGIQSWQASKSRAAAAGNAPHVSINAAGAIATDFIIVERAEFETTAGPITGYVGTNLGTDQVAVVTNRDARFTNSLVNGISDQLVAVADGQTAVVPPAVGSRIWFSSFATPARWQGPQLLRPRNPVLDQLTFQNSTLASTLIYTFYGYLIRARP